LESSLLSKTKPDALKKILLIIGLLIVTFVAYFGVLKSDFVSMDDPIYVTDNPYVNHGISKEGIRWALDFGHNS
jgi:hypothetical protein